MAEREVLPEAEGDTTRGVGAVRALRRHPVAAVALLGILIVLPGLLYQTARWAERAALAQVEDRARRTLALTRAGLASELRRHEAVPQLLAIDADVARFLASQRLPADIDAMNRRLGAVNRIAGSGDTYLMDRTGLTLAASNWDGDRPFVGANFSYRPYFRDAARGELGRYFALGTTSKRRGYYFAAPVRDGAEVVGVMAVKVDVAAIEESWGASDQTILVTDADGVVFMSNRPQWVFRSLGQLDDAVRERIRESRRYDDTRIAALPVAAHEVRDDAASLVSVPEPDGAEVRYLSVASPMPESAWTVHVLAETRPVAERVRRAMAVAAFAFACLLLLVLLFLQRRIRIRERLASAAAAKLELERRVHERTREISETNRRLTDEIAERRHAEQELRRTQRELIQASKLSALGEMSAGISHELNQPLAAIRSFAENAEEFLTRGRADDARANLERIGGLTARMARIIADLRTFARKDPEAPGEVSLAAVVDEALALLATRIETEAVAVVAPEIDADLCVRAEFSRLAQVLVNLLANALDAVDATPGPRIAVGIEARGHEIALTVEDNGTGIAPERINDIFDPFFTTKEVDEGLGLGLSISYGIVAGFGGSLRADNRPEGGARFTITLPREVRGPTATVASAAIADGR